MRCQLTVNGETHELDVPAGTTLLGALRDDLGLTGTKFGCGKGVCGSCFVLVEGSALPSCTLGAHEVAGKKIVTIEGLERGGVLHAVQRAFIEEDAMQCGYCTSGLIISATALLTRIPNPTDADIREALAPHLCRCGVYGRVLRAVERAAT
jgi:aerobic-type carbon monoxide dehydrogenase small subunit (CoxS/CutS family)